MPPMQSAGLRLGRSLRLHGLDRMALGRERARSKDWSEAELDRLKAMVKRGVSARQIAIALSRHVASVKKKVRELGLVPLKTR